MIVISQQARNNLRSLLDRIEGSVGLRLVIRGDIPGAYHPILVPVKESEIVGDELLIKCLDLKIYLDHSSIEKAQGLHIDLQTTPYGSRLDFKFPSPVWNDPITDKLQNLIDCSINPALQRHGGGVAILGVKEGTAELIMSGGCQGCALSSMTLSQGVAAIIKREIPEIHTVIDKTNHSLGETPYYRQQEPIENSNIKHRSRRKSRRKSD